MEAIAFGLAGVAIFGTARIVLEGFGLSDMDSLLLSSGLAVLSLAVCIFCIWLFVWRNKTEGKSK